MTAGTEPTFSDDASITTTAVLEAPPSAAAAPLAAPPSARRGAAVLLTGQAVGQAASFARNLIVARMIPAADFGVGATFAITMSLLQMLGDLSVDKLLVQAKDGDEPAIQASAQFVQFVRGVVSAALLFALAGLLCAAFDEPQALGAFRLLALVPLIQGFGHLDVRRFQRSMRFLPCTAVDAAPQMVATLAAWPLAVWLGDFRVVLWCVLLQAATTTWMSHALADRRYAWSLDRRIARRIFTFGWPLVVNALLLFAVFQGDRVVVGTSYGLEELGAYSLAFSIAFVPTSIVASVATPLVLPLLARVQDDRAEFARRASSCAQAIALATALVTIPLVVAGGPLIAGMFGTKYAAAVSVAPWLAAMQGVRILRVAPVLTAVARADTVNSMVSNLWRSLALGAMAVAAALHADLTWIAASGLAGEVVAFLYSVRRLERLHGLPWRTTLAPSAVASAGAAAALAAVVLLGDGAGAASAAALSVAFVAATVAALFAVFPDLLAAVRSTVSDGRVRLRACILPPDRRVSP